jgi:hypothetical protein
MDLEPHETTLPRTDAFTGNCRNTRHQENPNITLVEEIDVAITIITLTMKSAKKKLHHTYLLRDLAIRYLSSTRVPGVRRSIKLQSHPVIHVMDLEPHETTLPRTDAFTGNCRNTRHQENPNITLVEGIDVAITIITLTMKSAKKKTKTTPYISASRLGQSISRGITAKNEKRKGNIHDFKRAADRRQYNFLRNLYTLPLETQ